MSYRFAGTLTADDQRTTRVLPFDVPEGTTAIRVRFEYAPLHTEGAELPQQISYTVYGPTGWLAEINRPLNHVAEGAVIGPRPSAGTAPCTIVPGPHTVFLSTYRIVDVTATYEMQITFETGGEVDRASAPPISTPADRGPGWYRGDLHAHTWHSDGRWDPADLVAYMKGRGLDFCTLTDHNTVTGLPEHLALADDAMVTMGGSEMSTFHGHMLAVGVYERIEWRHPDGTLVAVPDVAQAIRDRGGFAVICHPRNIGDPWCCGCRWEHEDMMPGNAMAVEIWNGVWEEENAEGVKLWQRFLDEGHRLVATTGSDHHGMDHHMEAIVNGRPAVNVVYADGSTREAILAGLKRGSSYVSAGPVVVLAATGGSGRDYRMGEAIDPLDGHAPATLYGQWTQVPAGARVELVVDGQRTRLGGDAAGAHEVTLAPTSFRWATLEVWDDEGAWAISNPVYGLR